MDRKALRPRDRQASSGRSGHQESRGRSLRFDRWLFEEFAVSDESLSLYRIVFVVFLVAYTPEFAWVFQLPDFLFLAPPGLMQLFNGFPSGLEQTAFLSCFWLAAACVLLGIRTRVASMCLGVLLTVLYGLAYSAEKVHHHYLISFVPLALAGSNWGSHYALTKDPPRKNASHWTLAFLALAIGFVFLGAATPKLVGGWLSTETQAAYAHIVSRGVAGQNVGPLLEHALGEQPRVLWELLDWATVLIESLVLIAALRLRAFRNMLAVLICLHVGISAWMGIEFADYAVVYAAFVDWKTVAAWLNGMPVYARVLVGALPLGTAIYWLRHHDFRESVLLLGLIVALLFLGRELLHAAQYLRKLRGSAA